MLTLQTKIPHDAIKTPPHAPDAATSPEVENKISARQLPDRQEYPLAKDDNIKNGFDLKSAVEQCVAYLHGLSQLPDYPNYIGDRITSCTCLQHLPFENNNILVAAHFIVAFQGMHFNTKKAV